MPVAAPCLLRSHSDLGELLEVFTRQGEFLGQLTQSQVRRFALFGRKTLAAHGPVWVFSLVEFAGRALRALDTGPGESLCWIAGQNASSHRESLSWKPTARLRSGSARCGRIGTKSLPRSCGPPISTVWYFISGPQRPGLALESPADPGRTTDEASLPPGDDAETWRQ